MKFQAMERKNKPFSKTELKILVFNKIKQGYSYETAVKMVNDEIKQCSANRKKAKEKEKKDKHHQNFKEAFSDLIDKK